MVPKFHHFSESYYLISSETHSKTCSFVYPRESDANSILKIKYDARLRDREPGQRQKKVIVK